MASAEWYFDFVSPYSYLQCEQLPALETRLRIHYRPVLFAGLLRAHGQKGPAEIPAKRRFTYRFLVWQARKLGVPFKFPAVHPFNPLPLLRLAIAADSDPDAVRRIFRFVWRDGRLGDLPIEWAELMSELHLPDAQERIESPEVKAALRRNTDEAIAKGVFGVPTLAIGDELFWGADATAMAADYVAAGCRYVVQPVIYEGEEYPDFIGFGTETLHFGIQKAPGDNDPPSVLTWQIGVTDIDSAIERCRVAGISFKLEENNPAPGWSYRRLLICTPGGYRLALEGPSE
jgi:2-hydroxychromene-2-carboxylate isomerase